MYTIIIRPITSLISVGSQLSQLERFDFVCASTVSLEVVLELIQLYMVINQIAKHTMLHMPADGHGRGKVISSQKIKAIGEQIPLALHPRDGITKRTTFTRNLELPWVTRSSVESHHYHT